MAKKKKYEKVTEIVNFDKDGNIVTQKLTGNTGGYTRETTPALVKAAQDETIKTVEPTVKPDVKTALKNSAVKKYGFNLSNAITDLANLNEALENEKEAIPVAGKLFKAKNIAKKSITNAMTNMGEGALKTGEGTLDTLNDWADAINNPLTYAGNKAVYGKEKADKALNEDKKKQEEFIKKNLVQELENKTGYSDIRNDLEKDSLIKQDNLGGQIAQGVGGMVPSLLVGQYLGFTPEMTSTKGLSGMAKAKAIFGNVAKSYASQLPSNAILGASSYGGGVEEALNEGATREQARKYGLTNAAIEQGTEYLTGGIPGLGGKGGLDDIVEPGIDKISKGYTNALLKAGYGALGEGLEETTGTYLDALAKKGILGKDINWKDVNKEALQSGIVGAATGAILNSPTNIQDIQNVRYENQLRKQQPQQTSIRDQKIQDNIIAQQEKETLSTKEEKSQINNKLTQQEQQELDELQNFPFELDEQQERRMDELLLKQNRNLEKNMSPVRDLNDIRDFKEVGSSKINAYQYDNPEVKPYFQEVAKDMLDDLSNSTKGERYMTEDGEFKGVKRNVPNDIAELLDGENGVKYSYKQIEDGLNAIIKDNGAENKAVAKRLEFYIDQRLRNGYNDYLGYKIPSNREYIETLRNKNNQDYALTNVAQSEMSAIDKVKNLNEVEREALTEITIKRKSGMPLDQNDIATINYLNNRDAVNGLTGELSDVDVQIPGLEGLETVQDNEFVQNTPVTLQDSAIEYGYKGNSKELANIDNSLQKRGITARFDSSLFDNNNTNAIWINENGQRQVIFNPNANENTIIEEIATHELTHDLMSSENSKNTLKAQRILDYVKTLEGYQEARQNLEQAYSQMYDVNSQEFQSLVDEEVVADVLGKKLGDQEFVNQITNSNPSLAKRIYNWVVDKLDSIVNSGGKVRSEKLFWQNVKNNFEKAYRMESQTNTETSVKAKINKYDGRFADGTEQQLQQAKRNLEHNIKDLTETVESQEYGNKISKGTFDERLKVNKDSLKELKLQYEELQNEYKKRNIDFEQNNTTSTDNEGRKLTKQQQEYFKDSKEKTPNGDLRVMYHGTGKDFTVFDRNQAKNGGQGTGFYFTTSKDHAAAYGAKNIGEYYLNIKNPLDYTYFTQQEVKNGTYEKTISKQQLRELVENMANNEDFSIENYGQDKTINDIVNDIYSKDTDYQMLEDLNTTAVGDMSKFVEYVNDTIGTSFDGIRTDYERVVFKPEQIKRVDNKTPTSDTDIRYSVDTKTGKLKDSSGKNVKLDTSKVGNTGSLMAIHNLNEAKLKGILELDGFPVPSIAITNPNVINHNQFGDISVLFDKNTIDPAIKSNEVYDRDVWSPTFPQVDYELNNKGIDKVAKDLGIEDWKMRDYAEDNKPEYLAERLTRDENVVDKYVKDNNLKYETVYKESKLKRSYHKNQEVQNWIKNNDITLDKLANNKKLKNEYLDIINIDKDGELYRALDNSLDWYKDDGIKNPWLSQLDNDIKVVKGEMESSPEIDEYQTNKNKKEVAIENGLEDYLNKKIKEVYGEKGIRNDKEYLTPSGQRRSFWQLHDEYNLQNIVDALTNQDTKGTQNWIAGYGQIQAQMANKFNSIEDIKANESKLTNLSENNTILEEARSNIENDMDEIASRNDSDYTTISELLADFAKGDLTIENFKDLTKNYYQTTQNVPDSLINKIIKDLKNLKNLPTDYFEAKPQRSVGLDEVQAVVIPNNASTELKKTLQDKGLSYYEYDPKIDGDRNRVINQFDNLKFSKQSQSWNNFLDKNIKSEGTKTKLKDLKVQQEQYFENQGVDKKVAKILSEAPKPEKVSISEKIKNGKASLREQYQYFKRNIVDKGEAVYRLMKETKNPVLYAKYDKRGTTRGEANYDIGVAQTNLNGERYNNFTGQDGKKTSMSLNQIWDNVDTDAANQYLAHWLNIDRYGQLNESGRQMQQMLEEQVASGKITQKEANDIIKNNNGNKYVFGTSEITPEISKKEIAKLEKAYPELKRFGENVWQYGRNQLQTRVDAGQISQAQADQFLKDTPHYVRLQRNVDANSNSSLEFNDRGNAKVNKQIKEFKGSNLDILPFKDSMAQYTLDVRNSIRDNIFAQELAKTMGLSSTDSGNISSIDDIMGVNEELLHDNGDGTYSLTFYNEGVPTTIPISEGIYEALKPNQHYKFEEALPFKAIRKVDSVRKALLTDKNPMFLATNMMKDVFDAPLNSKYPIAFAKNYPRAVKEILTNGKYYQQYQALGGLQNTYFDYKGFKGEGSKLNPLTWIEKGNNAVEQFPRLAEFISTMEATGDIDQAMYNAAEITTNFKRGGDWTKTANRNGATFLNASVQGFSKQVRNFTDIQSPRQAAQLLGKIVVLGIAPGLINDAMWDDDEEYQEMQDYQKDRYYLFKGKNGQWIRIPKGRAVSVFQSAARRTKYYLQGDKDAYKGLGSFAIDQVAPNNPLDNNLFSPLVDVARNKSWSGNDIVSDSIKNESHPEEEYTIKTDEFSKWLGKKTKKSPAKINYLIDQYTGGVGDLVLPNITKKSTRDSDNLLENIFVAPFKDKFTTNAATSSKNQNEFYEALSKAKDDKNYSKATAEDKAVYKYLNSKNSEIADIRSKYVESQESNMSNKEKYQKAIEYTKEMNKVSKEAVNNSKHVQKNGTNEYIIGDKHYVVSGNDVTAVKDETMQSANKYGLSLGDYTDITSYYGSIKADKDMNGNTIPGSKKQKFINYVKSKKGLTEEQKESIIRKYYKNYKKGE